MTAELINASSWILSADWWSRFGASGDSDEDDKHLECRELVAFAVDYGDMPIKATGWPIGPPAAAGKHSLGRRAPSAVGWQRAVGGFLGGESRERWKGVEYSSREHWSVDDVQ